MSYRNLQAGDVVAFTLKRGTLEQRTAAVLRYLTFPTHVVVHYGNNGYTVDDSNFVRVVRSARGSVPYAKRVPICGGCQTDGVSTWCGNDPERRAL